jgi:PAS domain S-box-containing protein
MSENHTDRENRRCPAERYETVLETIRDGVYVLDETGHITWVNEVVVTEFDLGYSREDLVGMHVSNLLPIRSRLIPLHPARANRDSVD